MKTTYTDSNYLAKVVQLSNFAPIPGADRLKLTIVDYNKIIVGIDYKESELCLYFPLESQISQRVLSEINLFSDANLNADKTKKGFFGKHGRVKATRLRGIPSEGFVLPVSYFKGVLDYEFTKADVGKTFDTIKGELIVQKYKPKTKTKGLPNNNKKAESSKESITIDGQFNFHKNTPALKSNVQYLNSDDRLVITNKLHGTSAVFSNVLTKKPLKWYERLLKKLGVNIQDTQYKLLYSSRKVLKNEYLDGKVKEGFYGTDIWGIVAKELEDKIEKNITIYGEIVGYLPSEYGETRFIQKDYDYGCKEGEHEFYAYRITFTNPDGKVFELSHDQVKDYCEKYGIKVVPTYEEGYAWSIAGTLDNDLGPKLIEQLSEAYLEKDCHLCVNEVPEEGVIVRKDSLFDMQSFKLKSFRFLERETKELDNEESNIEE